MASSSPNASCRLVQRPILALAVVVWAGLLLAGLVDGLTTLVRLSFFGAAALWLGAWVSRYNDTGRAARLADAAAGSAMLVAALVFVVPHALVAHHVIGGAGLIAGLAIGLLLHYGAKGAAEHSTLAALTLHALCAGAALGALYSLLPALGWTAGVAILAHKTPAGYLVARQRRLAGRSRVEVAWPALATGLGALPVAMIRDFTDMPAGWLFGLAAGLFLCVALLFLRESKVWRADEPAVGLALIAGGTVIAIIGWLVSTGG